MTVHVRELPLTVQEVTPEWVADALRADHPDIAISDVTIGDVLFGSATKVFATVAHDEPSVPAELCVKGGFVEQLRAVSATAYANEARFYDEVAHHVPQTPAVHFAATSPDGAQTILIFEDLRAAGATFGTATSPLTPDEAAAVLDLQAQYHARFWDAAELTHLGTLLQGHGALVHIIEILTGEDHWTHHLGQTKANPVRGRYRDAATVRAGMKALWALDDATGSKTFIHGDTHLGNLWFAADRTPGYLDWQTAGVGVWAHDVATFIGGAMSVDDRRHHEERLLRAYLDRLNADSGADLGWDDAWLAYRQHLLHGFLWVLTPEEMQPEPITAANTERYAAAVADHDTLGLLGV